MTKEREKAFPKYGCCCDLDPGEKLTDCVVNLDEHSSCSLAVLGHSKNGIPRYRRVPDACSFWVKPSAEYPKGDT